MDVVVTDAGESWGTWRVGLSMLTTFSSNILEGDQGCVSWIKNLRT